MRGTVEHQMSCPSTSPFSGYSLCSVSVLVLFISSALLCSSFSSLLIFTVLVLSIVLLFKVRKKKPITVVDLTKKDEKKESPEEEVNRFQKNQTIVTGSQGLSSESGNIDGSSISEDSEVDWPFPSDVREGPACSDDSISDDDSLIEIELPEVNYFDSKEEPTVQSRQNLPDLDLWPDSMFPPQDLMELTEINEMNEENLIEIDISRGSIKCSRVEIEA